MKTPLGRAFTNLFTANLASSFGDGIARTAAPLLAVRLTTDPLLVSGIAAMALLPWLFFAIPAGILIDRIDRRMALAAANGVRTGLAVALLGLVATDELTIWWLYLIIFTYGACETVYDGAIRAIVPSIVPKKGLPLANSRIEAGELVVQGFLAGPFTSLLFAVAVVIPLGVNIAVLVLAVGLAFLLPKAASGRQFAAAHTGPVVPWYRQFVDGYRFIISNDILRRMWFFNAFIGLAFSAATAGFVLYLLERLGVPEEWFGIFMLSGAAGGIAGSVAASWFKERWGTGRAMAVANLVATSAIFFIGLVQEVWAAALGFFVSSAAVLVWNVLVMSLRQSIIPGRLLGRVHGTWRTLLWGIMPLGAVAGGLLGRIDLALPFLVGGAAAVVGGIFYFRFLSRLPNPEDIDNGDEVVAGEPIVPV